MNGIAKHKQILFVLGIAVYLSMFLDAYPYVYVDEPWESITAYQLYFHGHLNSPELAGRDFYDVHFLEPRVLQSVLTGPFFVVFGVNLFAGRLMTLLLGFVTLYALYRILKLNQTSGFLIAAAVMLLTTNYFFFIFSRTIRPEIIDTCFGLSSFYFLYRGILTDNARWFIASGLLLGIGLMAHPAFTIFPLAFTFIFLVEYGWKFFLNRRFWTLVLFAVIGVAPYFIYLVKEDWDNHFGHLWMQINLAVKQNNEGFYYRTFLDEDYRYGDYISRYRGLIVLIEVCFLAYSFRLKDRLFRFSRVMIFSHILLLPILVVNNRDARYLLPAIPFLMILIVGVLRSLELSEAKAMFSGFARKTGSQKFFIVAATVLSLNQCLAMPVAMIANRPTNYENFLERVRAYIPPHSKVWGSMGFWFGFVDCDYRTQYTYAKDLETFKPDFIITHDARVWNPNSRWTEVAQTVDRFVQSHYQYVGEVKDRTYGDVKIWKLNSTDR
jgi:4-amino-4-deoxy-L-arabinose transferase-like glycosyltransferase